MAIKIVQATPGDMKGIREVQKLSWLETYPNESIGITMADIAARFSGDDTTAGKLQMDERIRRFFQPNAYTWIVKDKNRIVGYCLAIKGDSTNRIQAIYLLSEYQGKGLGKKLIFTALKWLGEKKPVYLNVASYNKKAISFYEHIGFIKTGKILEDDFIPLNSGKSIHEIEMVKEADV